MYPLCKHCANNVPKGCFVGGADGLRCEKGVKECAQRATILAVWAVENPHSLPLPYIYVGVWAQVF